MAYPDWLPKGASLTRDKLNICSTRKCLLRNFPWHFYLAVFVIITIIIIIIIYIIIIIIIYIIIIIIIIININIMDRACSQNGGK